MKLFLKDINKWKNSCHKVLSIPYTSDSDTVRRFRHHRERIARNKIYAEKKEKEKHLFYLKK